MFKSSFYATVLSCFIFLFIACNSDDDSDTPLITLEDEIEIAGVEFKQTSVAPQEVYDNIINALNSDNENFDYDVVAEVDHSANAESVDLDLDFTRTLILSNPNLEIPLIQENIQAGLDLPQSIIVYSNSNDNLETIAAFNSYNYLMGRYDLVESIPTLLGISNELGGISLEGTGAVVCLTIEDSSLINEGIITVISNNDFETTYDNIIAELNTIEPISIVAEIDHQMNAADIGVELNPIRLVVFGNPALGTPLMQENPSIAVDLPQKMLIYENDMGEVNIIYNDPFFIAERHDVEDNEAILTTISGALMNIANSGAM